MEEPYAVTPPVRICAGPPVTMHVNILSVTIYGNERRDKPA